MKFEYFQKAEDMKFKYFQEAEDMKFEGGSDLFTTNRHTIHNSSAGTYIQGCNVRKVYCSLVYSVYILKPVLSGRNL